MAGSSRLMASLLLLALRCNCAGALRSATAGQAEATATGVCEWLNGIAPNVDCRPVTSVADQAPVLPHSPPRKSFMTYEFG